MQPEQFAELVVLTVKSTIAPLLERLAVAEQSTKDLQARVVELAALRDRLTTIETKAALAVPPVDPEPLIRDRLAPVVQAVQALEHRPAPTLTAAPTGPTSAELELLIRDRVEPLTKDLGTVRERLAAVELRPLIPGPSGNDGHPGRDGVDGKAGADGRDGFQLEDFVVDFDGDRTLTLKYQRGTLTKAYPLRLPYMRHEGVYLEGKGYRVGDVVTWGGSQWHCSEDTTTKPGDGSKAWLLIVKRGRDGKDGKDAAPLPVVTVARG